MFGSDCNAPSGEPVLCSGIRQLDQMRQLASSKEIKRKILFENARKLFRF